MWAKSLFRKGAEQEEKNVAVGKSGRGGFFVGPKEGMGGGKSPTPVGKHLRGEGGSRKKDGIKFQKSCKGTIWRGGGED